MLIIYTIKPGGVTVYNQNLINYLRQENVKFEVLIISFINRTETRIEKNNNIYTANFSNYSSRIETYNSLKKILSKQNLIICNDSFELEVINYYKLQCKVVFILHGDLQHYQNILNEKKGIIDAVFCVSQHLMLHYAKLFKNLHFLTTPPLTADYSINSIEPLDKPNLKIIYAGRLVELKGADLLNEVSKLLLKETWVKISYYLPNSENDENYTREIPKGVNVHYGMSNEEVLKEFESCDILLFPSRSEGFGLVIMEGMKRGVIPIVINKALGPKDMVNHAVSGFSYSEEDYIVQTLNLIKLLQNDRAKLTEFKKRACKFANSKFSFDGLGKKFLDSIDEVSNKKQKNKIFIETRFSLLENIIHPFLYKHIKYIVKR